MNRELTLSSRLPVYLYIEQVNNMFNRNRELIDTISSNFLCIDDQREYMRQLMVSFEEIDASAPIKKQLEAYLLDLFSKKARPKTVKGDFSEVKLCNVSKDRVYVAPEKSETEIEEINRQYPKITVCRADNVFDVLKPIPYEIYLTPGSTYNLPTIFAPFAKGSKSLGVIDPYIHNHRAVANLDAIASRTVYEKITIKCNDPAKLPSKDGKQISTVRFDTLIAKLRSRGSQVEVIYYDRIKHKERFILYDEVEIYIPGGLDNFDENGIFLNDGEGFYLVFRKRKIKL